MNLVRVLILALAAVGVTGCDVPAATTSASDASVSPSVTADSASVSATVTEPATSASASNAATLAPASPAPSGVITPGPDHPGAVDPRVTQDNAAATICVSGYSSSVRPVVSQTDHVKRAEMQAQGLPLSDISSYELDHEVPLELGGLPIALNADRSIAAVQPNLWLQPRESKGLAAAGQGAESKDRVENALHTAVCGGRSLGPKGRLTLAIAQDLVRHWWVVDPCEYDSRCGNFGG